MMRWNNDSLNSFFYLQNYGTVEKKKEVKSFYKYACNRGKKDKNILQKSGIMSCKVGMLTKEGYFLKNTTYFDNK
jgi:hypothetical protein